MNLHLETYTLPKDTMRLKADCINVIIDKREELFLPLLPDKDKKMTVIILYGHDAPYSWINGNGRKIRLGIYSDTRVECVQDTQPRFEYIPELDRWEIISMGYFLFPNDEEEKPKPKKSWRKK